MVVKVTGSNLIPGPESQQQSSSQQSSSQQSEFQSPARAAVTPSDANAARRNSFKKTVFTNGFAKRIRPPFAGQARFTLQLVQQSSEVPFYGFLTPLRGLFIPAERMNGIH